MSCDTCLTCMASLTAAARLALGPLPLDNDDNVAVLPLYVRNKNQ